MTDQSPNEDDIKDASLIYNYSTGPGWEYKEASVYSVDGERFILQEVHQHIDSESGPSTNYSWLDKDGADKTIALYQELEKRTDVEPGVSTPTLAGMLGCIGILLLLGFCIFVLGSLVTEKIDRTIEQMEKKK
ncbi:MAG: hypothetical protein P1V97_28640 [Planctomycetota bacterium]|nr:hypothetical protein [Planctomycetota bacterium]